MDIKGESTLITFQQKQVKKWIQIVSRAKIFSLFIVKFKNLGLSAPLRVTRMATTHRAVRTTAERNKHCEKFLLFSDSSVLPFW